MLIRRNVLRCAIFIALSLCAAFAQQTTTTATIVDSDGIVWVNAAYKVSVVSSIPPSTNPNNLVFPYVFTGVTDGTGSFSLTLQRVPNIFPAGSTWKFCVQPGVTNPATYCTTVPVGDQGQSSEDVSAQINAAIKAPRISGGLLIQGYDDIEFKAIPGNQYFNVLTNVFRCYSTSWGNCAGTGTGIGSITWAMPSFMTASPTSLVSSGTQTFGLATQNANTIFAGPTSGGVAGPTFRSLVSADIPNNAANTTGTSGGLTGNPSISITNLNGSGTVTLTGIAAVTGTDCLQIDAFGVVTNTGLACGSGGGGGGSFATVTSGTNTNTLVMGTGGTLTPSGGTITANAYSGLLPVANGGTGAAPSAGSQVFVTTSTVAGTWSTTPTFSGANITALNASNVSSGSLAYARLSGIGADTLLGNASGSSSPPAAISLVSCSTGANALTYNTTTHAFGCNTISGSGTVNSGTTSQIAIYASTGTVLSGDSLLTDNGTSLGYLGSGGIALGATPPTACTGNGCVAMSETSTAGTPTTGVDYIRADSTSHTVKISLNGGAEVSIPTSTSGVTLQTNGTNNITQTALNFITSTTNAAGLTATPSNPASSSEKIEITGNLLLANLATEAANTVVGNATAGSASPTALAMPSCTGGTNALTWTAATGFGCNTISALTNPMTTLGDIIYGGASGAATRLAGNTAATDTVLVSHGTGSVSAAPTFSNAPALSAANMGSFPTLNQNTTGTAGGLTGTPNITVGSITAGSITSNGQNSSSVSGAASASPDYYTGAIYTGGTGTTTFPYIFIQPTGATAATTWSTAGTFFGVNSATGFTGNFLDFHVNGGASVFSVSSTGAITGLLNASNLTSGTIPGGVFPALAGDVTSAGGSLTTTVGKVNGGTIPASAALTGTNGSSQFVAATGHAVAGVLTCADTSASGTAQSCTTSPSFTPAANDCVIYTTTTANSGAGLTLNVNALGAKSVAKWLGTTSLTAGDVAANSAQLACYNGTVWNLSTLGNAPSGGGGSVTLQTNAVNNAVQTTLNFITSTTNTDGLTVTPANSTSTEKFEVTGTTNAAGGGTGVSNPAAHSLVIAEGSSAFNLVTSSATNGLYQCGFNVTASAAVDPTCVLGGVPVNAQTSSYTLLYSDRANYIKESGGSTATLTLPQVTGNTAANMPFVTQNLNSGTETLTANAADKIDGSATGGSQTVLPNSAAWVYQDGTSAPGNWWTIRVPTVAALEQGSAGQLLLSGGASALPTAADLPDVKVIPAANCVSTAAGSSWNTALTPSCIAGTNNLGGSLPFVDASTAQFEYEIPADWDSATEPYFAVFFNSGTNTSGTVIFNVAVACTKSDGSITSDPAFNTADALTTKTMAAASRMWSSSVQATQVTSGNNCVAGGTMLVKITRATDTAAAAVNVTKATITFPRKPVVQAN